MYFWQNPHLAINTMEKVVEVPGVSVDQLVK